MTHDNAAPWLGDACSLVDSFRKGENSPVAELEATLEAISASELNAFSHVDAERARQAAKSADVSLPFGGVPIAVKELDGVAGWPNTQASLVFKDRVWAFDRTEVTRLRAAGAILAGQTTSSEFGGLNISISRLHGITCNPWDTTKTTGGSSAGSSAAVAGGLLSIATGSDGGGSIRIPAGFTGLLGMKGTAGRIPRGPKTDISPMTIVLGCMARSVRDVARYYDVCNGFERRDPYSLPRIEGWERALGTHDLRGRKAAIVPDLGVAILHPEVRKIVTEAGEALAREVGLELIDLSVEFPGLSLEWVLSNMAALVAELGELFPGCEGDLTAEIAFGLELAAEHYGLKAAAAVEKHRTAANETMAEVFDQVDFVIAATNPDVAFPANVGFNYKVGDEVVDPANNGALTIPANICGNPAVSIPAGSAGGLPVGMQVIGRHHEDALLLDLALAVERSRPWPLVAPGSPK